MTPSSVSPPSTGPESASESGSFTAPSVEDLGKALPQFEIIEVLGQGGMGAVYKARQPRLNRHVAIKLLPAFAGADEFNFAERFEREAQAMAQMNHSNIVTVHDFGETGGKDGLPYIVMEYVDGPDLHELIHGGQMTIQHVMGWIPQICGALQYAHERGVVHRDIKPANILINREGEAKVVDFGLATLVGPQHQDSNAAESEIAMGTPEYAPPEATEEGATIDHRADIYSLGVLFYEMLTGRVPSGAWKAPSEFGGDIDVRLDAIVIKAMQAKPEDRYQSVGEISKALTELRNAPKLVVAATGGKKLLTAPKVESRAAAPRKKPIPKRNQRGSQPAGMSALAKVWISLGIAAVAGLGLLWANGKFPFSGERPRQPAAQIPPDPPKLPSVSSERPVPPPAPPKIVSVQPDPPRPQPPPAPQTPEVVPGPDEPRPPRSASNIPPAAIARDGEWMDVLAALDMDQAEIGGSWSLREGYVMAAERDSREDQPRLELPPLLGDTYELELVFQRGSGEGNIVVMLPIDGERYAPLYLSGFYGKRAGIHGLDGQSVSFPGNPTAIEMTLENRRDYRVSVNVTRGESEAVRIALQINGDELFDWSGPAEQLPTRDGFGWTPRDKDRITLGTVSQTAFTVIRVRSESP